jgi:hypothetical protein
VNRPETAPVFYGAVRVFSTDATTGRSIPENKLDFPLRCLSPYNKVPADALYGEGMFKGGLRSKKNDRAGRENVSVDVFPDRACLIYYFVPVQFRIIGRPCV